VLPGTTLTGFTDVNNNPLTVNVGDKLDKKWFGAELQVFYDLLGGMALKGEYISGKMSGVGSASTYANYNSNFIIPGERNFSGYYATLIKNVGKSHQAIVRYDVYDPNTKIAGDEVSNSKELKYSTLTLSWQYFFDENVKIVAGYALPTNEKSSNSGVGADFLSRDKKTINLASEFKLNSNKFLIN